MTNATPREEPKELQWPCLMTPQFLHTCIRGVLKQASFLLGRGGDANFMLYVCLLQKEVLT